jgi:hypothetical protein
MYACMHVLQYDDQPAVLKMEAVHTSETSVYFDETTRCYIFIIAVKNLKSHNQSNYQ